MRLLSNERHRAPLSVKHIPIERAVLDGLKEMWLLDAVASGQVRDGAGDFQDAVVGASAERELFHRLLEHFAERGVERDVGADLRVAHAGVGRELSPRVTRELTFACGLYPSANDSRTFTRRRILQLTDRERGRLDVDVDAVEQRAANARSVFDNL